MFPAVSQAVPIGADGQAGVPASVPPLPPVPPSTGTHAWHANMPLTSQKQAISRMLPLHGAAQVSVPVQAAPGWHEAAPPAPDVPPPALAPPEPPPPFAPAAAPPVPVVPAADPPAPAAPSVPALPLVPPVPLLPPFPAVPGFFVFELELQPIATKTVALAANAIFRLVRLMVILRCAAGSRERRLHRSKRIGPIQKAHRVRAGE
jgi:hypothetical protein